MKVWKIATAYLDTKKLDKLLKAGWEPFSVQGSLVILRRFVWAKTEEETS